MIGIYLSGTGNTEHCIKRLIGILDKDAEAIPIESEDVREKILENESIVLAYPTQFSNAPFMVQDFIGKNPEIWDKKKVLCMTTMGLFSGDGTGCAARLLKKNGAEVIGGIQVRMPDAVCDKKALKKTKEENANIIHEADKKIDSIGADIKEAGKYPQEGLSFISHMVGLFGQRMWFYGKTIGYSKGPKSSNECIGCGVCVKNCPMKNLELVDGKALSNGRCTMCYRCISLCPKKALTLLGNEVYEQCRYSNYCDYGQLMN